MNSVNLTTWGTFLSGLGTLIIALVGGAILVYDVRLRRRQLRENRARSYSTLNVDFQVSVHSKMSAHSAEPEWILEARVILKNASSEMWAVPAVYVHARALPEIGVGDGARKFSEGDFYELKLINQLSEPKNIARFPAAIWHLAPDEIDSVVSWAVISNEIVRQSLVLIVRAEVYSVPNELIGASYQADNASGAERSEWMDFMEGANGTRHRKVIFAHARKSVDGIKKGDWVLRAADSEEVDVEATKRFRKVLASLCHTGRQNLVVLNGAKASDLYRAPSETGAEGLEKGDLRDAPNT